MVDGVAINIGNSGQLLSLLSPGAPGPGGTIALSADGGASEIDVKGTLTADRGLIDIRDTGSAGEIYLGGSSPDFVAMHADVIKVGALSDSGVLSIGAGMLSADSMLKLYAGGSNGTIKFTADVTLSGNSVKIIAANTVTIMDDIVVTIQGPTSASVYTNHANYDSASGGNGITTGSFAGTGATTHSFSTAPSFDDDEAAAAANTATKPATALAATPTPKPSKINGKNSPSLVAAPQKPASPTVATKVNGVAIRVTDSNQILDMLEHPSSPIDASAAQPPAGKNKGRHNGNRNSPRPQRDHGPRVNRDRDGGIRIPKP